MKTFGYSHVRLLAALALAAAPLAAESPQDLLARLAAPVVTQSADARLSAVPALALLPQQSEGFVVIPNVAEALSTFAKAESREQLECLGSAALSLGPGNADSMMALLSLAMHSQLLHHIEYLEDAWLFVAKPEYSSKIKDTFNAEYQQGLERLRSNINNLHQAPIYAVLTAAPGKDAEFAAFYQLMVAHIAQKVGSPSAQRKGLILKQEENRAVLEIPRAAIYRPMLTPEMHELPGVAASLEQGSLYFIVQKQDKSILISLCSDPAEVAFPASPGESLLRSEHLCEAGVGAPGQALLCSAWLSPEMQRIYSLLGEKSSYAVLSDVLVKVFQALAESDKANSAAFAAAADGAAQVGHVFNPQLAAPQRPATLCVSRGGDEVQVDFTCDAMGMHYEPGELRGLSLASAPETTLYAESTPATSPSSLSLSDVPDACLALVKGATITMDEQMQDAAAPQLMLAESLMPTLQALGGAGQSTLSGLGAPCMLVVSAEPGAPTPAVALAAAVRDRAALAVGWKKVTEAVQQGAMALGMPPNIISFLPIQTTPLAQSSAVNYTLMLPLGAAGMEHQLTVSDKSFVLSNNSALNNKLLALESARPTPFRGAVGMVNFDLLEQQSATLSQKMHPGAPALGTGGGFSSASAVITDHDGTLSARFTFKLSPQCLPAPASDQSTKYE